MRDSAPLPAAEQRLDALCGRIARHDPDEDRALARAWSDACAGDTWWTVATGLGLVGLAGRGAAWRAARERILRAAVALPAAARCAALAAGLAVVLADLLDAAEVVSLMRPWVTVTGQLLDRLA